MSWQSCWLLHEAGAESDYRLWRSALNDEVVLTRDGQERKINVRLQSLSTAFGPFDLDVREGDFLQRADCPQALVVSEVAKYRSVMTGSDVAHTMLKLVTTSKWHEMQQTTAPSAINQNIECPAPVAARNDLVPLTGLQLLEALQLHIEGAKIPAEEKKSILTKLQALLADPYFHAAVVAPCVNGCLPDRTCR
jgi:hypothetical protein